MIRCGGRGYGTKGILYTDEKFKQNIEGATSAGIKVGVYFYSQAITCWCKSYYHHKDFVTSRGLHLCIQGLVLPLYE